MSQLFVGYSICTNVYIGALWDISRVQDEREWTLITWVLKVKDVRTYAPLAQFHWLWIQDHTHLTSPLADAMEVVYTFIDKGPQGLGKLSSDCPFR